MGFWFLDNLTLLDRERTSIEDLYATHDWFVEYKWLIGSLLKLNATLAVGEHVYQLTLHYPSHFPFVPIFVQPSNNEDRWSSHQYLDGTLCLEWGPDTWDSKVTGADMLLSAFRLLDIEQPNDHSISVVAPSRHQLSTGQRLRQEYLRICITQSLNDFLNNLPPNTTRELNLSLQSYKSSSSIIVKSINLPNGELWEDPEVPTGVKTSSIISGKLFCLPEKMPIDLELKNMDELKQFILAANLNTGENSDDSWRLPNFVFLRDCNGKMRGYFIPLDRNENKIFQVQFVYNSSSVSNPRLEFKAHSIDGEKVGIVGLGSLGSKIAVSLARSGFRDFVLIDDDVFLAENIVRNQLDWLSIGDHKVDAVAMSIERIVPNSNLKVHKLNLIGQENNSSINGAMNSLAECNIVIDATSNPSVLNILSSLYSQNNIPIVWGHVFEGGFGGMIARSRPEQDPSPLTMRRVFYGFCEDYPFPGGQHEGNPYEGMVDEVPMIASDSEVTIISGYLTSFAVDTLLSHDSSRFPYSLYLIGLSKGWVFDEPFQTIPISTDEHLEKQIVQETSDTHQSTLEFLTELVHQSNAKDTDTTADS